VATDISGFKAVMEHGTHGLNVPPRDARALADAILTLIRDAELRQKMGERGKEYARQFDWPVLAERLLAFYRETLDRVHGGASPETV
jgi:phosphatidylinositol alpha-mannosyltransferase